VTSLGSGSDTNLKETLELRKALFASNVNAQTVAELLKRGEKRKGERERGEWS
jgi:hypothetical protein